MTATEIQTAGIPACPTCGLAQAHHPRSARASLPPTTQAHLRRCDGVRRLITELNRGLPDARPCRFGDGRPRQPGRTVCDFHLVLGEPCMDCGGVVLRREGRGRQPVVCAGCDLKRAPSKRRERGEEAGSNGV